MLANLFSRLRKMTNISLTILKDLRVWPWILFSHAKGFWRLHRQLTSIFDFQACKKIVVLIQKIQDMTNPNRRTMQEEFEIYAPSLACCQK